MFIKNDSELKPSTQELITAFDSYFSGWQRERMGCRREPWGVAVTWVIELDGREIGRVSVGPLPRGGGFRISQASTAQGIERQLYGDVMDDLEWAVNVALGLREPGVRIKRRPEPPSKTQAQEQQPAIPTTLAHRKPRQVSDEIAERAAIFKRLKDANPHLSYLGLAHRANMAYGDALEKHITADDVRNAYRAMGWEWERGDKIR